MSDFAPTADRRSRVAAKPASPKVLMLVLSVMVVAVLAAPAIRTGVFDAMSTDDAMRLVEVRDLIAGQGWFDLAQHRLGPPGVSMHWSRVIDAPLAAVILIFKPLLGIHAAEAVTLFLWPTLLLLATILLLTPAIAGRLCGDGDRGAAQLAAVILAALSVPALVHFRAGAIDHHNVQIVLLLALVLLTSRIEQSVACAGLAGGAAALSLAIGVEMLPAIAAICLTVFGLLIRRGPAVSRPLLMFGAALSGSSLLLAGLLLPLHSLAAPVCDAFGGPFLLLMAGGGATLMIVVGVDRWRSSLPGRLVAGGVAGSFVVGLFFGLFPGCLASPFAMIDPLVTSFWFDRVAENMSFAAILQLAPQKLAGFYGFPILALGFAVAALLRSDTRARFQWIVAVVSLVALIGISIWEMRGSAGATSVAAPVFAASLASLWPARAYGRKLLIIALAASPTSLVLAGLAAGPLIDRVVKPAAMMAAQDPASSCQTVSGVAPLADLPRGRVMAPIDLGPAILAATEHEIFAAPYHRNSDGNLAMIQAMMAPPEAARRVLTDRHVTYVVICRGAPDQADFLKLAPDGLAARLGRGDTPDFLEPLTRDPAANLSVWRMR
ncbi:MAG TPA: hypothetical protein VHQ48_09970 [Bradyrhizobium sp.]|jgi:hypothetical protein|nr:hypothetical protein [Bradyrhizobium sp.]